jgi:hypothetical protein
MPFSGQCLCGKVRYSVSAERDFPSVCHCEDCRRHNGLAFAVVTMVPKSAISVQGPLRAFRKIADSGRWIERQFCSECGSSVLLEVEARPGGAFVQTGTADDASAFRPKAPLFCSKTLRGCRFPKTFGRSRECLSEIALACPCRASAPI